MEEYIKKSDLIEEFTGRQQAWENAADSTIVDKFAYEYKGIARAYKNVCAIIELMPSVNVAEVKHGSWRKHLNTYETDYTCSECGGVVQDDIYPFCPWCGADMRGENK